MGDRHHIRTAVVRTVAAICRHLPELRGRGALAQWLGARLQPSGTSVITMRAGHRMVVPWSSRQAWIPAFTGHYDDALIALLADRMSPGATVVDVGASVGFWTVPLAVRAREVGARVVAVEPLPHNVALIQRSLCLNGVDEHTVLVPVAVGSRRARLAICSEPGGVGNAAIDDPTDALGRPEIGTVEVYPLDDLLAGTAGPVVAIKLDVEGYELEVLRGAERTIREHRPTILGEFSAWWLERRGEPPSAPWVWATDHDYRVYEVVPRRMRRWSDRQEPTLVPRPAPVVAPRGELLLEPDPGQ